MSLSEFDKLKVQLIPASMIIPSSIELPQYQVEEQRVVLEYMNQGNGFLDYNNSTLKR